MEEKIYVIDWDNGMVGIFRGSDLSQIDNGTKGGFFSSLKHVYNVMGYERVVVEFLKDREQLQQLRESKGLKRKPTLDEWLINEIEINIKKGDFNKDYLEEKK